MSLPGWLHSYPYQHSSCSHNRTDKYQRNFLRKRQRTRDPSDQTGVYSGWVMFPSAWVNFKFYEVAKNYTEVGFGAITWHGLTINKTRMAKLPKDVQAIIIEVAKEFEAKTGSVNQENYPKQVAQLKTLGVNVKSVPEAVKLDWANSLKDWPQAMASDLDARGMPGSLVLKTTLEEAEKMGHKWPVRYVIK